MASVYPDEITIEGETLDYMKKHSELITILLENQRDETKLDLDSEIMFGGDKEMWKVFLDIFFPEEGYGKLFTMKNNKLIVRNARGGEEAVMNVLRYMMVDEPGREIQFAKEQARRQINAPAATVARGEPNRAPGRAAQAYANRQADMAHRNAIPNNVPWGHNNNNNWGNNNEGSNSNGPKLGYTEEEEGLLGKLSGKNRSRFAPNNRRRVTRRTRRSMTRRKQTRRVNRK